MNLDEQIDHFVENIRGVLSETPSENSLCPSHYHHTAHKLDELFFKYEARLEKLGIKREDLWHSGLLHGLPFKDVENLAHKGFISKSVLKCLGNQNVKQVVMNAGEITTLRSSLWSDEQKLPSVLLMVADQLDRLETFCHNGVKPSDGTYKRRIKFTREALIPTCANQGLWEEKNRLDDICAELEDPEMMENARAFQEDVADVIQADSEKLAKICNHPKPMWHFHHLKTISEVYKQFKSMGEGEKPSRLWLRKLGFFAYHCANVPEIYMTLYALHKAFPYERGAFKDYFSKPKRSYRAIHTDVDLGDHIVRLKLRLDNDEYTASVEYRREPGRMIVYTPATDPVDLREKGTVLEFASKVRSEWVAYLRAAYVDKIRVDIFHQLQDGDVVELDIADTLVPLPPNWSDHYAGAALAKIRRRLAERYNYVRRNISRTNGINILRQDLAEYYGYYWAPSTFHMVLRGLKKTKPKKGKQISAMLEKLGEAVPGDSRNALLLTIKNSEAYKWLFKKLTAKEMCLDLILESADPDKDIPANLSVEFCSVCNPKKKHEVVGEIQDPLWRLLVHRRMSACKPQAPWPLQWKQVQVQTSPFFVFAQSRQGLLEEIILLLRNMGLAFKEFTGIDCSAVGYTLFRMVILNLDEANLYTLTTQLKSLKSVKDAGTRISVIPDDYRHVLPEHVMAEAPDNVVIFSPYHTHGHVDKDTFFYGRQRELKRLKSHYESCHGGMIAALINPLRTGKTSLFRKFLRDIKATRSHTVMLHTTLYRPKTWLETSTILANKMRQKLSGEWGIHLDGETLETFHDQLDKTHPRIKFIYFIDEAMLLLSNLKDRDFEDFRTFMGRCSPNSGLSFLLAGPPPGQADLPPGVATWLDDLMTLELKPFNVQEVQNLLCCTNFKDRYRITLNSSLVERCCLETGGNPYFIQLIARELWDARERDSQTAFTEEEYQFAKDRIFEQHTIFANHSDGHLHQNNIPYIAARRFLLGCLAEEDTMSTSELNGRLLDTDYLTNGLESGKPFNLHQILEGLTLSGTVSRCGRDLWSMAVPLHREFAHFSKIYHKESVALWYQEHKG